MHIILFPPLHGREPIVVVSTCVHYRETFVVCNLDCQGHDSTCLRLHGYKNKGKKEAQITPRTPYFNVFRIERSLCNPIFLQHR